MRRSNKTAFIYSLAAIAGTLFWITRQLIPSWKSVLPSWLIMFSAPLLFVYAYPRFLFHPGSAHATRLRSASIFHGIAAMITSILFLTLGSAFWRNPMSDADSILLLAVPIVAVPLFLVAALSLLFKNNSSLANFASFLFWPYWLLLALSQVSRFFAESLTRGAFCFFCFLTPILFAFAAGTISHRPTLAHISALAGMMSMPWIYWTTLEDTPLGNVWTTFNVPDQDLLMYDNLHTAEMTICSIGLIVLAGATAALRLLPVRWSFHSSPLSERTWPAFGASIIFLAVWFSQSVMPYRISGAVDYATWPMLQILHVEKRGLQFHETGIDIWGHRNSAESVSFSENNRRLFQFRFQQKLAHGELSGALKERIQALVETPGRGSGNQEIVKPLRAWDEDGWYIRSEGGGLMVYTTDNGATPPQEIVGLFNELKTIPYTRETKTDRKDVCLGFCYDPLSGMGALYANHRCRYDGHDYVCR